MNPDLDDEGLGTAIYWDTYFGADKDRYYKKAGYDELVQRVDARQFSVAALSGSLLQYGKQGISLHYGKKRTECPDGRTVYGIPLSEVIWQARNQALHWEDGSFHEPTTKCRSILRRHEIAQFVAQDVVQPIIPPDLREKPRSPVNSNVSHLAVCSGS